MRNLKLNGVETNMVYSAVNGTGNPAAGLSTEESRNRRPLFRKIKPLVRFENGNMLCDPGAISLKESEYEMLKNLLDKFPGWLDMQIGELAVDLLEKLKELPNLPDEPKEKGKV